jgi:beta-glucanase (GH16 family)
MRKLQHLLILIAMLVSTKAIKAQIPINDPAWIYQTSLSDDFNGTSLDGSKWYMQTDSTPGKGLEMMFHRNVEVAGGTLKIKIDTLNPNRTYNSTTYKYQSGTVISTGNGSYKYGYIEIYAKFPTGHRLYWPGFWLEKDTCNSGNLSASWYEEIDICEYADYAALNGHYFGCNWHINVSAPTNCPSNANATDSYFESYVTPLLSSGFHKYALEWRPEVLNFYFDDNLIRTIPDTNISLITPKHGLNAILDLYITNWITDFLPPMLATNFEIAYFYYYKLIPDCTTNSTICIPTDYDRKVKKIILTNTTCTPTYNPSTATASYTLRATDYVVLDVGTLINPTGTGYFAVDVIPCLQ